MPRSFSQSSALSAILSDIARIAVGAWSEAKMCSRPALTVSFVVQCLVDRDRRGIDTEFGEHLEIAAQPVAGAGIDRGLGPLHRGRAEAGFGNGQRQHGEAAVAKLRQVPRRHAAALDIVDPDRRDRLVVEAEIQRHEGQLALARQLDQPRAVLDAEDDEAVDQRALDVPGELLLVDRRDQRDARRR